LRRNCGHADRERAPPAPVPASQLGPVLANNWEICTVASSNQPTTGPLRVSDLARQISSGSAAGVTQSWCKSQLTITKLCIRIRCTASSCTRTTHYFRHVRNAPKRRGPIPLTALLRFRHRSPSSEVSACRTDRQTSPCVAPRFGVGGFVRIPRWGVMPISLAPGSRTGQARCRGELRGRCGGRTVRGWPLSQPAGS
jgi:hypothetical protein